MLVKIRTKTNRTKTRPLLAAMTLLLALTVPAFAHGQEQQKTSTHEMKVPETAKDHYDMAEHYQKVAAEVREDIEMHKKMLADFTKSVAANPKSGENPYAKNMRLHCDKYIKAAEALAAEADASAKFHTMRAKELEGK
jgi:uncharacterized protein HemX